MQPITLFRTGFVLNATPSKDSKPSLSASMPFQQEVTTDTIRFSADKSERDLNRRMKVAKQAAKAAGQIIMHYYNDPALQISFKKPGDLVTQADREADTAIMDLLKTHFPEDAFFTEESSQAGENLTLKTGWVIDPLDGTRNFANKVGPFGVSIAYLKDGKPTVGVIYDPIKKELFTAITGKGAFCNDRPIHVNGDETLEKTTILSTFFPPTQKVIDAKTTIRRLGSSTIDLVYVASGRMAASCERNLKSWDVAAGILIVQEAGGKVTTFKGEELDLKVDKLNYLASNNKIHEKMVALIQ